MGTSGAVPPSSVFRALALSSLWLAGLAALDGARAQNVVNPDFSFPSAANAPNGYIEDPPTTSQIGWTFSKVGANTSGVQANGSAFNAPAAPGGLPQTAYIDDLNSISQNIEFKQPGDYQLSFQIAEYAHNTLSGSTQESVMVRIGTEQYGPFTPFASTTFDRIAPIQFKVATANSLVGLTFVGTGPNASQVQQGQVGAVFIAQVAITAVAPQIACPQNLDIDPTSTIKLTGQNFGSVPGRVQIQFSQQSAVAFKNSSFPNSASKSNLLLNVPGPWGDTITTEALDQASDVGAAPAQTVEITIIAANGQSSNVCKANFHDKPVIMGLTSGSISPGQSFNIWGWDFGNDPGKVTIHFTSNFYPPPDYEISDAKWKAWVVNARIQPDLAGVVEQDVDISLTPKGGNASNAKTKTFKPTMYMGMAPATVVHCGNETTLDLCNPAPGTYSGGADAVGCLNPAGQGSGPGQPPSIWGFHWACFSDSSDNGQDIYSVNLTPQWTITAVDYGGYPPSLSPGVWVSDNTGAVDTSMEYTIGPPALPTFETTVTVNWHIGPSGEVLTYAFNVWMKGPVGVAFTP